MKRPLWLRQFLEWILPPRTVVVLDADSQPESLPLRKVILLRDSGEDWSVGFRCPCGCGQRIELPLIREADPHWNLRVEPDGTPTLAPSVWRKDGCRSHFFLRSGRVKWV
jgi:Family of unknown function (DUF6527)